MAKKKFSPARALFQVFLFSVTVFVYLIPFYFIFVNALKSPAEASQFSLAWPTKIQFWDNLLKVVRTNNGAVLRGFYNSLRLTVFSVAIIVTITSMLAFVMQRRKGKVTKAMSAFIIAGLIVPPSVVPTYWMLDLLGLARTLPGLITVEVALNIAFATILYRGFITSIPKEIDESAIIDGCDGLTLFFRIIFPLLKPVTSAVIVVASLHVYNDFVNPLYFLPGAKNTTIQLSIYYFYGMFESSWNLVFTDILIMCLPIFIIYLFFNRQIVDGMVTGSIKG
jgi:raffinose/stachyose/melibiose transport system permease protein